MNRHKSIKKQAQKSPSPNGDVTKYQEKTVVTAGPLPAPEVLSHYNEIIENGAERIMAMAEQQSLHRIEMEKSVINHQNKISARGQAYGLIVALFGLAGSITLVLKGHDISGSVLGGSTLLGLVSVFVIGQSKHKKPTK